MKHLSDAELIQDLAECISLEGEAKARAKPLREELLRRCLESGEMNMRHEGWQTELVKERLTLSGLERLGYCPDELPTSLFREKISHELDEAAVRAWLDEQGTPYRQTYSLRLKQIKHG